MTMPNKRKGRIATIAFINGRDFQTLLLIRDILNEALIWSSHEGSCGVDIYVFEEDAKRADRLLRTDRRLAGAKLRFPQKPILGQRVEV